MRRKPAEAPENSSRFLPSTPPRRSRRARKRQPNFSEHAAAPPPSRPKPSADLLRARRRAAADAPENFGRFLYELAPTFLHDGSNNAPRVLHGAPKIFSSFFQGIFNPPTEPAGTVKENDTNEQGTMSQQHINELGTVNGLQTNDRGTVTKRGAAAPHH